ncbi:MAG: CDP-alcohol phosphatidyltransferase family protein [Candidatus Omnitrophota bacterium]
MLTLANKLSIFRILLIPVFITTILYYSPEKEYLRLLAIAVFLLAILSDALDGYIARVHGQRTKLGMFLDPLADKLLLSAVYISLAIVKTWPQQCKLPPWVVIVVISRDVIILLGSTIIYMVNERLIVSPTSLGKITTFFQMATIMVLLLQLPFFYFVMYTMIFFTIFSGVDYIRIGSRLFNDIGQEKTREAANV